ncbi:MAG TPA: SDR family NAD(P)-dependent oxidoreductase [Planctomycetota bacterium]|nr:SDR family NAD(P)-dependent oxidoreductase [Planctomycetota bacterium]
MINLSDKHICVIGGSRGIGAGSAKLAGSLGARVSITYGSNKNAAEAVVSEIRKSGPQAAAFKADMQNEGEIDTAVDAAVKALGPIHGMVVSAGIFENTTIDKMTLEFWNRVIGINLTGTMLSVRAAARVMRANKTPGSVVIYTSTAGQSGGAGASAYCTSKAGQIIFMKSMAYELAAAKIRVNCIAPAWTETDMADASLERLGRDKVAKSFPLGRIGKVTDIANATAFLLSDAAEFITGSTVTVDGGLAMRG